MGPRPPDFDEVSIRQSPAFAKWVELPEGGKLRYACRDFVKGRGDDEERLMRRIMIARRNNIRDHETLKKARKVSGKPEDGIPISGRKRRPVMALSDQQVEREMDVAAVEATRSYQKWARLKEGEDMVYNAKYTKGREGHDWLLKKNIWRRMRYRRENKKMLERLKTGVAVGETDSEVSVKMEAGANDESLADQAAVEAAVAVAESFKTKGDVDMSAMVHNPLDTAALDAAAKLAAATGGKVEGDLNIFEEV
jgi:hypothetical protein